MSAEKCPICGQAAAPKFRPFCSPRCADLDLHRWLNGRYAVPGDADGETPGEAAYDTDPET